MATLRILCVFSWGVPLTIGDEVVTYLFCRGDTNRVFGKPCLCPVPKRGRFDENGENDEFEFYPLKTRASLLRPPKMTKMTKITQAKAWFRKSRGLSFHDFVLGNYFR